MLKSLEIENIAVIEKVSIDFDEGMNVLTGETGAGKSIIIDSINAVLGLRTSRDLVRKGASYALVIAEFSPVSEEIDHFLFGMDIDIGSDNLILQRKIGADGKSSCRINSKPVSAGVMRQLAQLLVNIHGQHDSQQLLEEENHYLYLDQMLEDQTVFDDYCISYRKLVKTLKQLKALETDEEQKQRLMAQLQYEIEQIESAAIVPGEKEQLLKRKEKIRSAASTQEALLIVKAALNGNDEDPGAIGLLANSLAAMRSINEDSAKHLRTLLLQTEELLQSAVSETESELRENDLDPASLDEIEQRLGVYYEFSHRYGKTEDEILTYLQEAKEKLNAICLADKKREELEIALSQQKEETYALALALREARKTAARVLEEKIISQLQFLNMPHARFQVQFGQGAISKTGIDEISFLICLNAGEELKPLVSVASGGELSRIMLAFRAVLGEKEAVPTLIFDEIDTGVSGRAAGKVGLKLREVSGNSQVICVTHLAQIAAAASHHFLIYKQVVDERTYTKVRKLDFEGRMYEIARITGGMNINEIMLENARQMLKEYQDDNI